MPKTYKVISDVFVTQVWWAAVPNTWPSNSKASVAKCVVCAWNSGADVLDQEDQEQRLSGTRLIRSRWPHRLTQRINTITTTSHQCTAAV